MDPLIFAYEMSVSGAGTRKTTRVSGPGMETHMQTLIMLVCLVAFMMGMFVWTHRVSRSRLKQGGNQGSEVSTDGIV